MKKLIAILSLALCLTPLFAQKRSIVVGHVGTNSGIKSDYASILRSRLLQGFTSSGRLDVVDGTTLKGLSKETSEAIGQLQQVEGVANVYYFEANLESVSTESSSSDGKTNYSAKTTYTYKIYAVSNGALVYNGKDENSGSSSKGYDDAIVNSYFLVDAHIRNMVQDVFRVSAEIKAINETHPKKGIRSLYLGIGSNEGVTVGNYFDIMKVMEVAGEEITERIGALKVSEVKSGTLCLCKVTKGGKELQKAMDDDVPIKVVSRPAGLLEF